MSTKSVVVPTVSQAASAGAVPNPPKMAVWLYLLLAVVTLLIFPIIWGFRVSAWMRNVDRKSHAVTWWAVGIVMLAILGGLYVLLSIAHNAELAAGNYDPNGESAVELFGTLSDLSNIPFLIALYSARSPLLKYFNSVEPIGLKVNGILLFFLQSLYLQYKLNQVAAERGSVTPLPTPGPAINPWQPAPPPPQAAPAGLSLQIAGQRHPLALGGTFTAAQIPGLTAITAAGVVARVTANPVDPTVIGLNNQSQQTWYVTLPGGEATQIASGQTIRLSQGAQFWFGQIAGVVV